MYWIQPLPVYKPNLKPVSCTRPPSRLIPWEDRVGSGRMMLPGIFAAWRVAPPAVVHIDAFIARCLLFICVEIGPESRTPHNFLEILVFDLFLRCTR